jgi:choline dehydrogenase-like flavoprotein
VLAKADADVCCVRPALRHPNVELAVRSFARRIVSSDDGKRATAVEIVRDGETSTIKAGLVVVACGAVNSAALLLRSSAPRHPRGLANGSGVVGAHYMVHNNSLLMTVDPLRRNAVTFQKTF